MRRLNGFGGRIRFFLWWKRRVFSAIDLSPLDGREPSEGIDGAEEEFRGNVGGV